MVHHDELDLKRSVGRHVLTALAIAVRRRRAVLTTPVSVRFRLLDGSVFLLDSATADVISNDAERRADATVVCNDLALIALVTGALGIGPTSGAQTFIATGDRAALAALAACLESTHSPIAVRTASARAGKERHHASQTYRTNRRRRARSVL